MQYHSYSVDSLYDTYCMQVISNGDYHISEAFKHAGICIPDPTVMHMASFTYAFRMKYLSLQKVH